MFLFIDSADGDDLRMNKLRLWSFNGVPHKQNARKSNVQQVGDKGKSKEWRQYHKTEKNTRNDIDEP